MIDIFIKHSVLATPILLTLLKKLKDNNKGVAIERYYKVIITYI